jgi:hypothetical protein
MLGYGKVSAPSQLADGLLAVDVKGLIVLLSED